MEWVMWVRVLGGLCSWRLSRRQDKMEYLKMKRFPKVKFFKLNLSGSLLEFDKKDGWDSSSYM